MRSHMSEETIPRTEACLLFFKARSERDETVQPFRVVDCKRSTTSTQEGGKSSAYHRLFKVLRKVRVSLCRSLLLQMLKRLSAQGCYPLAVGLAYSRNNSETHYV
jgi:hypothetical protein